MKCVLCDKEIPYGNNPWPLRSVYDGDCCDECNREKVIPARRELWKDE